MEQVDERGNNTTLVHFVFQVDPERVACMPNMVEFHETPFHKNVHRTNSPQAVTCAGCKQSSAYRRATGQLPKHVEGHRDG